MSKYAPAIIMGFVVGFATSFLMRAFVFPEGSAPVFYGAGTGMFVAYILGNLAGNRKEALATGPARQQALAFAPPPGKTLVVVYRDGFVGKMAGLNLAIDGREFAQIKSPRFTALVVPAGQHTLSCAFGGLAGPQSRAGSYAFDAAPGQVVVVNIGARMGMIQGSFQFTPAPDLAAAKAKLDQFQMVQAEPAEV
jgi:hypothetical protein